MSTVIIGSGIIGVSTAYFLSEERNPPSSIHLVEASPELFASASGFAAGFLARDWFSPSLSPLGALSFDLHRQLAEQYNGRDNWSYTGSITTSLGEMSGDENSKWLDEGLSRARTAKKSAFKDAFGPQWLTISHENLDIISNCETTAQIDPLRLCQFLMSSCLSRGVRLHQPAQVTSIHHNPSGNLSGVCITHEDFAETEVPCTHLVLAAGAWTAKVFSNLFPEFSLHIPISPLAGHSILLRSPLWPPAPDLSPLRSTSLSKGKPSSTNFSCHAVFTSDTADYNPELFSRLPGYVYIAGLNSSTYPLPSLPTKRIIDPESISTLMATAKRLMGEELEVLREGVCWRPLSARGTPCLGKIRGKQGVWIAAGHGAWGISLSLGTGKVMAEMLQGKETSADVSALGL